MIGILILNYKKYQVTADCIRSVLDTGDGLDYHIYVLDNGSGNDSIACLQARFPNNPRITWMESAENTGYARPGKYGLYNILIMEEKQTIVALGAGSITKRVFPDGRIERCDNVKDVGLYIEKIDEMIQRKQQLFSEEIV